jgi:DNA-binding response OmpR family regulator
MPDEGSRDSWATEHDFLLHVEKELQRLLETTRAVNWVNSDAWDAVVRTVHNLRGTATMVGHPIISRIFEGLEKKLNHPENFTDSQLREEVDRSLKLAAQSLRGAPPDLPPQAPTPAAPASVGLPPASLSPAILKQLKPLNILVVDDDENYRSRLRGIYQPLGMTIFEMDRGSDLTPDFLAKKKIHAVVLDLKLPGEDGYSICKRLKASPASCHVPIVFVSVAGELESRLYGWQVGAEDFVVKPIEPLGLLLRVQILVQRAAAKRAQQQQFGVSYDAFLARMKEVIEKVVSEKEPAVLATLSLTSAGGEEKQHAAGVKFLPDQLRRGDVLCSPAAGSLMILQPDITLAAARKAFETIALRLKKNFCLDCRVGLAQSPNNGRTTQDLLAASKECLDRALAAGEESLVITPRSRKGEEAAPPKLVAVDDDEVFLNQLGKHFAELGFNIALVNDSRRAVEFVRQSKPDLVTLDVMMPDPDGLKLLETFRKDPELADTPVIMISGKGEEDSLLKAFALGANDYLVKPFRFPELDARVRKALRERVVAD